MTTLVKPVHPLKASRSISITELGMTTSVRSSRPQKALASIRVVPSGMKAAPFLIVYFSIVCNICVGMMWQNYTNLYD